MSAFVVDTGTMDRVVRGIIASSRYGQIIDRFADIDTTERGAGTRIGRLLFSLNIEAVFQRYPGCADDPGDMPGPIGDDGRSEALKMASDYTYRSIAKRVDTEAMVHSCKAMRCLRYQCSEGDVPGTELYRELQAAIGEIALAVVEAMPCYSAAPWG